MRMIRSVGLAVIMSGVGLIGLGAGNRAQAQVGFSYSNWGRGGNAFSVNFGNPYAFGYPVAPAAWPVYSAPVVVAPMYPAWVAPRPVMSPYWRPPYGVYRGGPQGYGWHGHRRGW